MLTSTHVGWKMRGPQETFSKGVIEHQSGFFGRGQPREAWVLYGAGSGHLHRKRCNANVHNIRHNAFVAALNS